MSYIRSTQSPEGLYIWGDDANTYVWCDQDNFRIPSHIFDGLLKKVVKNYDDVYNKPIKYKGACVFEECIKHPTEDKNYFQVALSYRRHKVYMWDVTWSYILQGYKERV